MEKKPLDRSVVAVLNAVDMEEYIPLFEEYEITWELLTTFTEDDCRVLGIDNSEHTRQLVKHMEGYRNHHQRRNDYVPPRIEDVLEALQNSENHTRVIDVSTDYVCNNIQLKQCFDKPVGEGKSLTSAIQLVCDRIKCENDELLSNINYLIENYEPKQKTNMTSSRKSRGKALSYLISAAVLTVSVAILYKNYLQ